LTTPHVPFYNNCSGSFQSLEKESAKGEKQIFSDLNPEKSEKILNEHIKMETKTDH
jgi:hypothetical protein